MKVVITKKHTENTYFLDCDGCALHKAISEQHPSIELKCVAGNYIRTDTGKYSINSEFETGWNCVRFYELKKGVIDKYEMEINIPYYDNKQQIPEPPKEKIKTVYVTTTIKMVEQALELIGNKN